MFEEIQEILEEIDKEHAITIREIAEELGKEEKRIADVLKKMRVWGAVAFEKREVKMIAQINYSDERKSQRLHKATPYFYWGLNNNGSGNKRRIAA